MERLANTTKTAGRPIIFIGHSLGGLLVKEVSITKIITITCVDRWQALVRAIKSRDSDPAYLRLCEMTHGILFFGVPHLGLRNETLTDFVKGQPNRALVESLVVNQDSEPSSYLARITEDFGRYFYGQNNVVSFYERAYSPTPVVSCMLQVLALPKY